MIKLSKLEKQIWAKRLIKVLTSKPIFHVESKSLTKREREENRTKWILNNLIWRLETAGKVLTGELTQIDLSEMYGNY